MACRVGWGAPVPEKLVYVVENGQFDPFCPAARSGFISLPRLPVRFCSGSSCPCHLAYVAGLRSSPIFRFAPMLYADDICVLRFWSRRWVLAVPARLLGARPWPAAQIFSARALGLHDPVCAITQTPNIGS